MPEILTVVVVVACFAAGAVALWAVGIAWAYVSTWLSMRGRD